MPRAGGTQANTTIVARLMSDAGSLRMLDSACIASRMTAEKCDDCIKECPVLALQGGTGGPVLVGECLECGRCAAACRTGALWLPAFEVMLRESNKLCQFECEQAHGIIADRERAWVPCLGGISVEDLLELTLDAAPEPIVLVDRGWCGSCVAGGGEGCVADGVLARANAMLVAVGWPEAGRPRIKHDPLPLQLMKNAKSDANRPSDFSRRVFFLRMAGRLAKPAVSARPVRCAANESFLLSARERLTSLLARLQEHPVRLAAHAPKICNRCEAEFAAAEDEDRCPACRKDAALFANMFTAAQSGGFRETGNQREEF